MTRWEGLATGAAGPQRAPVATVPGATPDDPRVGRAARRVRGVRCVPTWVLLVLVLVSAVGHAQPQVAATEHVRIVFEDPRLEPWARRAAAEAEASLARVAALFGSEPFPVTLVLADRTDVFNALATPIPRPTVSLRAVAPVGEALGWGASSWLELLLVHELTHLAHFTRTGAPIAGAGLVGEGVALPPPLWLVEGIATWVESDLTDGGRRDDPRTAGLLATLALGDDWPTLAEASTGTHAGWPGGATRYLLGAGFLDALVAEHGWAAVVDAIRAYNEAPLWRSFADVWEEIAGTDLGSAWDGWHADVASQARSRRQVLADAPARLTETGWETGVPAVSPDGARLAWRTWPPAVAVADLREGDAGLPVLNDVRRVREGIRVGSLAWLDDDTLAYTRIDPTAATSWSEVFVVDLTTGAETRWTEGGRAHFVRRDPEPGCLRFVRAAPAERAAIVQGCGPGPVRVLWRADAGVEIVGFDVAADGRMVATLWEAGRSGLTVLERTVVGGDASMGEASWAPRTLTWDRAMDLDPAWTESGTIRFRSDRTERFELWEVDPATDRERVVTLLQLTATLGGAFHPAGDRVMVVLGPEGFDLAAGPSEPLATREVVVEPREAPAPAAFAPPAEAYAPWSTLAPFGWLPSGGRVSWDPLGLGLEAQVYGLDASAAHAWTLTAGFDTALSGPAGPVWASVRYTRGPTDLFATFVPSPPATVSVEAGLWPHAPHLRPVTETALGIRVEATGRLRGTGWAAAGTVRAGLAHLDSVGGVRPDVRADAVGTTAGTDRWGYPGSGLTARLSARWTPAPGGPSVGAWLDATARTDAGDVTVAAALRAGYRPSPPVPVALEPWAGVATLEGRGHAPIAWRWGDGRYALERLTWAPAVRAWVDGRGVGFGADLALGADLLANYAVPVTIRLHGGWSDGPWVRVGVGASY